MIQDAQSPQAKSPQPFWFQAMSPAVARRWQRPWVAMTTVGVCVLLFGLQWLAPQPVIYTPFFFLVPQTWFEAYRLLTPIFLHFSIMHIAFNTALFWFFGRQIEALIGRSLLLSLIVVIGLVSNIGQFFAQGAQFGGLSGVVMGLISFVWLGARHNLTPGFFMPQGLMPFVVISLMLGFTGLLDRIFGPIAHVAHALGFMTGLVLWPITHVLLSRRGYEDSNQ